MQLVIHGKNIDITDAIRSYVEQKLERAAGHFQNITQEIDVHLSVARNPRITTNQTAEVTIYVNGSIIRAEESSDNLYASVDLVADKVSRKLRKLKEKRQDKSRTHEVLAIEDPKLVPDLLENRAPELPQEVVRVKYFAMPAMTVEAALEHLEMVDHDFYVFRNAETGEINVIYERNHGGYGVIQPRHGNDNQQTDSDLQVPVHAH